MFFSKKNKGRKAALRSIRRFVVETNLTNCPETQFKVYGLTGPETCHNVTVYHVRNSPYTLTTVSAQKNVDGSRPVSIKFFWKGLHVPEETADAVCKSFELFFPVEDK